MCDDNSTGYVTFYAYENASKKGKRIIGQKAYSEDSADFATYFAADKLNPQDKNPKKAAYEFAKGKKDVGQGDDAKSFFDGGIDV